MSEQKYSDPVRSGHQRLGLIGPSERHRHVFVEAGDKIADLGCAALQ